MYTSSVKNKHNVQFYEHYALKQSIFQLLILFHRMGIQGFIQRLQETDYQTFQCIINFFSKFFEKKFQIFHRNFQIFQTILQCFNIFKELNFFKYYKKLIKSSKRDLCLYQNQYNAYKLRSKLQGKDLYSCMFTLVWPPKPKEKV